MVFEPEYLDASLYLWASAKLVDDSDEDVGNAIWLGWLDGCDEAPCIWGDDTGDGDEESDRLLDRDIAEPCKEWEIGPDGEVPVDDNVVNEEPPCPWFEGGAPGWFATLNSWLEYNWSTAECIGNTASILHSLLGSTHNIFLSHQINAILNLFYNNLYCALILVEIEG